jgi:hypothetical protein
MFRTLIRIAPLALAGWRFLQRRRMQRDAAAATAPQSRR